MGGKLLPGIGCREAAAVRPSVPSRGSGPWVQAGGWRSGGGGGRRPAASGRVKGLFGRSLGWLRGREGAAVTSGDGWKSGWVFFPLRWRNSARRVRRTDGMATFR